jgi:ubiquinone/menaquinone biosynthesis C-methylase UbiE
VRDTRVAWEELAADWDRARRRAWPEVAAFAESFAPGARVLDLAGGNGRHAAVASKAGARVVVADFSRSLLAFAAQRGIVSLQADARELPFVSGSFDGAMLVAALHCIPSRAGRIGALAELRRVLRPGGRALVTVWSRFSTGGLARWHVTDADVPWGGVERYYHFYSPVELGADCRAAGWAKVELRGVRQSRVARWLPDNWFLTLTA